MNEEINKLIDALPPNKQLLFGVCCVKRIENCLYKFLKNKEEEPAAIVVRVQLIGFLKAVCWLISLIAV